MRSSRSLAAGLSLTALLAAFVVAPATLDAQTTVAKTPSTLGALPAGTTVVVRLRSLAEIEKKWDASPLAKLAEDPSIKKFIDDVSREFKTGAEEMRKELGFDPFEMIRQVEGEVVFAIGGIDKVVAAMAAEAFGGGAGPPIKPGDLPILLSVDTGGGKAKFQEFLGKLYEAALKDGAARKDEDFQSGKITTLTRKDASGPDDLENLFIGEIGSTYLISIHRPFLESALAGLSGSGAELLVNDADYKDTSAQIGDSDLLLYVNLKSVLDSLRKNLQANPIAGMVFGMVEGKLLGRGLRNIAANMSLAADGLRSSWFVHTSGSREGLLAVLDGPGFSPGNPGSTIPGDVTAFSRSSIHFGRLYAIIKDVANMAMSMSGQGGVDVEQFVELQFQIKLREVIDAIGSDLLTFSRAGGDVSPLGTMLGLGNITFALSLKSEEPIRKLIQQVGLLMGGGLTSEKYMERDIFKLDPSSGDQSPVIALADKQLLFALTPSTAKEFIRRQGKETKSIADDDGFKALSTGLPESVVLVEYYAPESLKQSLQALEMLQSGIALPDMTALVNLTSGSIGHATWVDKGLRGQSVMKFKGK